MNHQINIDEAIAIAKEYHLEIEVTECIKQGMSPIEALYDEWYQIDSTLICDYCIIPEADYILKEDTSFLNESISAGVKCYMFNQ